MEILFCGTCIVTYVELCDMRTTASSELYYTTCAIVTPRARILAFATESSVEAAFENIEHHCVSPCVPGGDVYKLDYKLYHLLPRNDTQLGGPRMGRLREGGLHGALGSCALVGNSGSLLYREYGKAIDAHDVVYRFNQVSS